MKAFRYEVKNYKQIVTFYIVFLFISLVLTQIGISKVKNLYSEEQEFITLERRLIDSYGTYYQYGAYGIRLKIHPSGISALYVNSAPFIIESFLDSGTRLNFSKAVTYDNAIEQNGYLDYSWFISVIGSLLIVVWGWGTFRELDKIKFLISIAGRRVKSEMLLARAVIILAGLLILLAATLLQFYLNGLGIDVVYLGMFIGIVYLNYLFWLVLSAYLGIINSTKRIITMAVIWLGLVMMLPEMEKYYFHKQAKTVVESKYKHDGEKFEILMRYEDEAYKRSQRYETKEEKKVADKNSVEQIYKKIEHPKLVKLEQQLISNLEGVVQNYQFLSSLTPMTFLRSVGYEVSTAGYHGYTEFSKHTIETQKQFMYYITDNLHLKFPNYDKVKPFIEGKGHIYYVRSTMPQYCWFGALWLITQICLLMWSLNKKFDKVLFKNEPEKLGELEMKIKRGKINILLTGNCALKQHLFNYYAGDRELDEKITLQIDEIIENNFAYLYQKEEMDKIPPKNLAKLLSEKEDGENWKIILNYAERMRKVLILEEYFKNSNDNEIKKIVDHIQQKKLNGLIITNDKRMACWLIPADKIQIMANDESLGICN